MKSLFCFFFALLCFRHIFAQYKIKDSCGSFTLTIEAKNLQSDSIRLFYHDCDKIEYRDTFFLSNGKAIITGKINRATEGILFTNIRSKWMDGPRVIRFIIEPTNMLLRFTIANDTARNVVIEGSYSQKQKESWESDNASILQTRDMYENKFMQLIHQNGIKDSVELEKNKRALDSKLDVLKELLITQALKYVKANPNSYFSGYLLDHYKRRIPTDTLETYYCYLDSTVIYGDFGKSTLDELLKLTDNWAFRQKFTDSTFYKAMKKIKTIYDVSLKNQEGTETSFSKFKGNFILIDFWARWCNPCIRNAPYLKRLITDMKNKPVKVISVSMDYNADTWKESIKKYSFPGIHLFDDKGLLSTFYKVLWVPRYIIVNPDGTIANRDAPQPNDPELKLILDNLIKNK